MKQAMFPIPLATTAALSLFLLAGCASAPVQQGVMKEGKTYGVTRGVFRENWWNYFERGVSYMDGAFYQEAEADLKVAVGKREEDARRARSYGMHFVDYFPHRELGIIYFMTGRLAEAERELVTSVEQQPSAKADFYLNKVRQRLLERSGADRSPPGIVLDGKLPAVSNAFSILLRGEVTDDHFVSGLKINGRPYRFDRAEAKLSFEQQIDLAEGKNRIRLEACDLVGHTTGKELTIDVDRQAPQLAIESVSEGRGAAGKKLVTIFGSVWDAHGVQSLTIEGKPVRISRDGSFKSGLEVVAGLTEIGFEVRDMPGNRASGSISLNVPNDLVLNDRNSSMLLAAAPTSSWSDVSRNLIAKAAGSAPMVRIKSLAASQEVFWDQLFLEGRAIDDASVVQVSVNGVPVLRRPGRQVFFSTVLPLKIGKNVIAVESKDGDGNVSKESYEVIRKEQAVKRIGQRLQVSLMPLDFKGESSESAELVGDNLMSALVEQHRFRMVERAQLEKILAELKLGSSELADPANASRVGKLVAAQMSMAGSVLEQKQGIEVVVRMIDTETSEIVATADVYNEEKTLFAIQDLMAGLALKLKQQMPLLQGLLIKRDGNRGYIDLGTDKGIKSGMRLISFVEGEPIIHPITGKKLGADNKITGELKIVQAESDFSICEVVSDSGMKVMDQVIAR